MMHDTTGCSRPCYYWWLFKSHFSACFVCFCLKFLRVSAHARNQTSLNYGWYFRQKPPSRNFHIIIFQFCVTQCMGQWAGSHRYQIPFPNSIQFHVRQKQRSIHSMKRHFCLIVKSNKGKLKGITTGRIQIKILISHHGIPLQTRIFWSRNLIHKQWIW